MIKKFVHYIKDSNLKIRYFDNNLNIINYDKILEIKDDLITIVKNNSVLLIRGKDLKITKLLDNELLISGIIKKIEL